MHSTEVKPYRGHGEEALHQGVKPAAKAWAADCGRSDALLLTLRQVPLPGRLTDFALYIGRMSARELRCTAHRQGK